MSTLSNRKIVQERIEKLEKELQVDNEEDFLFCLKCPLIDRIVSKLLISKKSVKFINLMVCKIQKCMLENFKRKPWNMFMK